MARLARLRLVNLGHPDARFDDLVLDFRGPTGEPQDSTLWLRNGGGKSSILNLYFSLVQPNRQRFLGAKADQKGRELEDYVLRDQPGMLLAEWILDGDQGLFGDEAPRYLTGAFLELRDGQRTEDGKVERLFFAMNVLPDVRGCTLEGVETTAMVGDGMRRRHSMASFAAELRAVARAHPAAELRTTSAHKEWLEILDAVHLDPELFWYQIQMNAQEGGADQLFTFTSTDEFIDFFLRLIIDPAQGDAVARNLATHQAQLRRRADEWIPEQHLLGELLRVLAPVSGLREQRAQAAATLRALWGRLRGTLDAGRARINVLRETAAQHRHDADEARREAADARETANQHAQRGLGLRRWIAEHDVADATTTLTALRSTLAEHERAALQWKAAISLRDERRARGQITDYQRLLAEAHAGLEPVRQQTEAAADRLAAALLARALEYERVAETHAATIASQRAQAIAHRTTATAAQGRASTAEANAQAAERRRGEAQKHRERLTTDHGIPATESVPAARHRLVRGIVASQAVLQQLEADKEARDAAITGLHTQRRERAIAMQARVETRKRIQEALTRAERRADDLLHHPDVVRVTGSTTLTEASLTPRLARDLEELAHRALDRVASAAVDRATTERAIQAITHTSLLPPSREVERVLALLQPHMPCWSGWAYLATNATADEAWRIVEATPLLPMGVVVRTQHHARATEHLRAAIGGGTLPLDQPMLLTTDTAMHDVRAQLARGGAATSPDGVVLGPTDRAALDPEAAKASLATREATLAAIQDQASEARREHDSLVRTARAVEQYRTDYPIGWREQETAQSATLDQELETLASEDRRDEDALTQYANAAVLADTRAREERETLGRAERARDALEQFARAHPKGAEGHEQDRLKAEAEAQAALAALQDALTAANTADQTALELEPLQQQAALQASGDRADIARLSKYRTTGTVVPEGGDVEALDQHYQELVRYYEGQLKASDLQSKINDATDAARKAARAFETALTAVPPGHRPHVHRASIEAALNGLADPGTLEPLHQAAHDAAIAIRPEIQRSDERCKERKKTLSEVMDQIRQRGVPMTWPLAPEPPQREAAAADAARAASEAAAAEKEASEFDDLAAEESAAATSLDDDASKVEKGLGNLQWLTESHERLRHQLVPGDIPGLAPAEVPTVDLIDATTQELRTGLHRLSEQVTELDADRAAIAATAQRLLGQETYAGVTAVLVSNVRGWDGAQFEQGYEQLAIDLTNRRQVLTQMIEDVSRDRDMLVDTARSAALEGLQALKHLARQSRIPAQVSGLGNKDFLRITTHEPADVADQRARLALLIDAMVGQGTIPRGLEFIQRAVRALAGDITVKILFPDPDSTRGYVPVTDLAVISGGERLTSATLLYCTLARMRAHTRGRRDEATGVLLLDNPIGKASRPRFIELQREVARQMGIQLLYLTGINDLEAIRMLPGCIRLRNERRDARTGRKYVEIAPEPNSVAVHGVVEAARLVQTAPIDLIPEVPVVIPSEPVSSEVAS